MIKYRLLFPALLSFFTSVLCAQNYQWDWAAGSSISGDFGLGCLDAQNNVYLAGIGAYIVKYDANGSFIRADSGNFSPISIAADIQGNVYLFGLYTYGIMQLDNIILSNTDSFGDDELFAAKYNAAGDVIWAVNIGDPGVNFGFFYPYYFPAGGIAVNASGIYITSAFWNKSITVAGEQFFNTDTSGATKDILIAKMDTSGKIMWAKSYGGSLDDIPCGIAVNASNDIYVTGPFTSPDLVLGKTTLATSIIGNAFLAKFDSLGNVVWAKSSEGGTDTAYCNVAADNAGNAFITGSFISPVLSFDSFTLNNTSANYNVFVAKYNPSGNVEWAKQIKTDDDTSFCLGYSIATDYCGDVWVSGGMGGAVDVDGIILSSANQAGPSFIAGYTQSGANINNIYLSDGGDDMNTIMTDAMGNVYIAGDFWSDSFTIGNTTLKHDTGTIYEYVFAAKYAGNVSCSDTFLEYSNCKVYLPNAFTPNNDGENDYFFPYFPSDCALSEYTFEIYNRWGQQVFLTHDMNGQWDGRFHGVPCDLDVYMYFLEYKSHSDNTLHTLKGNVTLIR